MSIRREAAMGAQRVLQALRRFTAFVAAAPLVMVLWAPSPALGQITNCNDQSPNGPWECTYRPQVIDPWRYHVPGPIKGTLQYLEDESATKDEYKQNLAANCPNCCEPGLLVQEGPWGDTGIGWLPDVATAQSKSLRYLIVGRGGDGQCLPPQYLDTVIVRMRTANCEKGAWQLNTTGAGPSFCYRPRRCLECLIGNPISLPSGSKVFKELDYQSSASPLLRFVRHYRSDGFGYPQAYTSNLWQEPLGLNWVHSYQGYLQVGSSSVWVTWGATAPAHFTLPTGSAFPRELSPVWAGQRNRLVEIAAGDYLLYTAENQILRFLGGKLVSMSAARGGSVSLAYGSDGLGTATDHFGRVLTFGVNPADKHLTGFTDPAGQLIAFQYKTAPNSNAGVPIPSAPYTTLKKVTYQDQTSRQYQVLDWDPSAGSVQPNLPTRIRGVVDELGNLYETVTYDSYGYATSSELAGGVDKNIITSNTYVSTPLGSQYVYTYDNQAASPGTITQPAGSGSASASQYMSYDASSNLISRDDPRSKRSCFGYILSRNLESTRVEGLAFLSTCSAYLVANATLPDGARKTSTQWHPDWRLQTKVAEPGRITTYVYNGQPDPFNGGVAASCAPAGAVLPNGKPIGVLCRQVEQATTDVNGALGFGATLDSVVANRDQKWTYNQYGQVLTYDGPRTDVADVTTYAYYSDTSFTGTGAAAVGHTTGDLLSITNPAGKVTQYTKYDKHGNVLEIVDANGVVTSNSYNLRQRLLTTSVGGQTTTYAYDLAGQLKRVTKPDGSWLGFDYDPAHRQIAAYDNLGNRIDYTLDNAGNRTGEAVKDTSGALRRQIARSIDALGRVQQVTGRE